MTDEERARAYYARQHMDPNNKSDAKALAVEFDAVRASERLRIAGYLQLLQIYGGGQFDVVIETLKQNKLP